MVSAGITARKFARAIQVHSFGVTRSARSLFLLFGAASCGNSLRLRSTATKYRWTEAGNFTPFQNSSTAFSARLAASASSDPVSFSERTPRLNIALLLFLGVDTLSSSYQTSTPLSSSEILRQSNRLVPKTVQAKICTTIMKTIICMTALISPMKTTRQNFSIISSPTSIQKQ